MCVRRMANRWPSSLEMFFADTPSSRRCGRGHSNIPDSELFPSPLPLPPPTVSPGMWRTSTDCAGARGSRCTLSNFNPRTTSREVHVGIGIGTVSFFYFWCVVTCYRKVVRPSKLCESTEILRNLCHRHKNHGRRRPSRCSRNVRSANPPVTLAY